MQRRQFVILEHDHPFRHWDFLIEDGDSLASWRLLELPRTGVRIPASPLPAHRRDYLTYEGPVSGDRGSVQRIHAGSMEVDGIWPDADDLPGLSLRIVECSFASRCMLCRHEQDTHYWEFG